VARGQPGGRSGRGRWPGLGPGGLVAVLRQAAGARLTGWLHGWLTGWLGGRGSGLATWLREAASAIRDDAGRAPRSAPGRYAAGSGWAAKLGSSPTMTVPPWPQLT